MIQLFHYEEVELPTGLLESSGRALNNEYQEKLISKVIYHFGRKWLLPAPIRAIYTTVVSVKYIWKGIQTLAQGKIEVPVLDATAIGVSMLRGDYGTAGSVMFLLGVGELLENGRIKIRRRSGTQHVAERRKGMAEKRRPGNSRSV